MYVCYYQPVRHTVEGNSAVHSGINATFSCRVTFTISNLFNSVEKIDICCGVAFRRMLVACYRGVLSGKRGYKTTYTIE